MCIGNEGFVCMRGMLCIGMASYCYTWSKFI